MQNPVKAYQEPRVKLCVKEKSAPKTGKSSASISLGAGNVGSCHQCRYIEYDNGNVVGHKVVLTNFLVYNQKVQFLNTKRVVRLTQTTPGLVLSMLE